MRVVILGVSCNKCEYVYRFVQKTCEENDVKAEVEFIQDMTKILEYGVAMTPAVLIDGDIKCVGRVPSKAEMKAGSDSPWVSFPK